MRTIIIVLCVWLLATQALASGDDECCGFYSPENMFQCTTHEFEGHEGDHGNCVWWASYKRPDLIGVLNRSALYWWGDANAVGLPTGQTPTVGAVAVFDSTVRGTQYGHVAYVEQVYDNDHFKISEMGYESWDCVRYRDADRNSYDGLLGFIYPTGTLPLPPSSITAKFSAAYSAYGGNSAIGVAFNDGGGTNPHLWYGVWLQNFQKTVTPFWGTNGQTALVYNPDHQRAYLVKEGFWGTYALLTPQELGYPTSEEQVIMCGTKACARQYFTKGTLWWDPWDRCRVTVTYTSGATDLVDFCDWWAAMFSDTGSRGGGETKHNTTTGTPYSETTTWPCTLWDNIYRSRAAQAPHWSGLLYNGRGELCGAWAWRGLTRYKKDGAYYSCSAHGRNGCIMEIQSQPKDAPNSVYNVQLATDPSWSFSVTTGKTYRFSGYFRTLETAGNTRQVIIAITPQTTYDPPKETFNLNAALASPHTFTATTEWQHISVDFIATASAEEAALRIYGGYPVGRLQIDELRLDEVE